MDPPVIRPFLTVHVFGSRGCGKTTFKTEWFESSQARAVSEIADMHIRIQRECSYSVLDSIRNEAGLDGGKHEVFVIIYRPDSQDSIQYGQSVLDKIYTTFDYTTQVNVTFIENHFEKEFKPHTEEPAEFPLGPSQEVLASRNPPQLWRVALTNSVQVSAALDFIITKPLLEILDSKSRHELMKRACVEGRVQVVKLLAGTVTDINCTLLIAHTMASLEQQLKDTPPGSLHATPRGLPQTTSSKTAPLESKLAVAYYLYYMESSLVMSVIARSTQQYPQATLMLIKEFGKKVIHLEHLVMTGMGMLFIPTGWVANAHLTYINLSNNLLTTVPEELFQLAPLQGLILAQNCLEAIPSVLRWNCPKLKELDVSHNRLVTKPYCILEGRKVQGPPLDSNPPSIGSQQRVISAAQTLLNLTGYNLYPCLCSITRVCIGHNPALTQIPEWVCVLPSLTLLQMKGLPRVTHLTPHLTHCRSLCLVQLDTAHLISPPPDQAQRGTRNILAYLRCQLRGSTPYRHIKLVIVGEKGAGKSTLFRQLVRGNAHGSSPNMDVATFEYPSRIRERLVNRDKPRITFHVIDFAGDEVYRCTHNCFLTYRSIYLCLWNLTGGRESLQRLCPWLHSIQACVPGSPVLLVATHANRRPGLGATTILQWEEEVLGKAVQLKNKTTARRLGFPPIMQSIVMDCLSREDIDMLLSDLYTIALQMRHPQTNVPLMSDMLPRSYQELQTLVEVKVRSLCLERRVAPVLRHEELVDYVRSLTISNPHGLEQDEEEFSLACHFLHEVGAIVHYKSQVPGVSDLYFLDPQWLFNALAIVVKACGQGKRSNAVVGSGEWPHYFQRAGIPVSAYKNFLAMMEHFNIIVSLDFEKNDFLLPSLLPDTPPPHYPTYDLSSDLDNVIVQYIELEYLPPPLFPQLIARVVLYVRQLSGQLLSIVAEGEEGSEREAADSAQAASCHLGVRDSMASIVSLSTLSRRSQAFHIDRLGYLSQDDLHVAGHDDMERLKKIWGLSTANFSGRATPDSRYRDLMQKLATISQPILQQQGSGFDSAPPSESSAHSDQFANYVVWKKGLFCEFPCGTMFWLEACENAIALVISGDLVPRVKVLSFLSSSIDALLDECYLGLKVVSYSPCPTCLGNFWKTASDSSREQNFAVSSFEQSCQVQINEFKESILFLHRLEPVDNSDQSQSFSGSNFALSMSPTPSPDSTHFDETPRVAMLESTLTLFPLSTTVQQSVMSSNILCPSCEVRVSLETISPDVLLVDFKHSLLLKARHLQFEEDANSTLGKGGFGKVFSGTYKGEPVAVKVFRKGYHEDIMLRRYKDLREELTIMCQLQHPRVVALVGVCLKPLAMVLKLAPMGSLKNHIDLCPHGMQSHVAHQVLYQIADGVRYLHSLYIIHRDIKPSNVLVWALHPTKGVDVKLADYGVSQFSSPSGLRRHKGTEEYMAPELFHDKRKLAYDEKVDVFSFGLVLHVVVTGRRLFASIMSKREQLHLLYHNDFPQLSSALADALADNKPLPSSPASKFPTLLEEGAEQHPAGRQDVISSCHSVCMQPLMESCLASNPQDRPSAQGLCSSLLVCPGATAQSDYYITAPIQHAVFCPKEQLVVGIQGNGQDQVTLFPPDTWQMRRCPTPYSGQVFTCMEVIGSELFLASSDSQLLYSLHLPSLQTGHISSTPLTAEATSLFACPGPHGPRIIVGTTLARISVYSSQQGAGHILDAQPHVIQVLPHPDARKKAVRCGLSYGGTLWCGCGTYLIGLDPKDLLMKHYKSILPGEEGEAVMIAASHDYVWVGFQDRSCLVVCSTTKPNNRETLECHSILGQPHIPPTQAVVTAIASGPAALWVGTKGGHLLAFNPVTADVLLVHQKRSSISLIVSLSSKRLVTFGEGVIGEEEEEAGHDDVMGMFTVWENYIE